MLTILPDQGRVTDFSLRVVSSFVSGQGFCTFEDHTARSLQAILPDYGLATDYLPGVVYVFVRREG